MYASSRTSVIHQGSAEPPGHVLKTEGLLLHESIAEGDSVVLPITRYSVFGAEGVLEPRYLNTFTSPESETWAYARG